VIALLVVGCSVLPGSVQAERGVVVAKLVADDPASSAVSGFVSDVEKAAKIIKTYASLTQAGQTAIVEALNAQQQLETRDTKQKGETQPY